MLRTLLLPSLLSSLMIGICANSYGADRWIECEGSSNFEDPSSVGNDVFPVSNFTITESVEELTNQAIKTSVQTPASELESAKYSIGPISDAAFSQTRVKLSSSHEYEIFVAYDHAKLQNKSLEQLSIAATDLTSNISASSGSLDAGKGPARFTMRDNKGRSLWMSCELK